MYDVIVIGSGPAGLSAAIHSSVFDLSTLVLEHNRALGGIATKARGVDNYPGFQYRISGQRLMEKMVHQAEKKGAELHASERVIGLSLRRKVKVVETSRRTYECRALILASGDGMKGMGMKWETWLGGGVAYCAECSAPFVNGRNIIIVGNVDDAVDEALRLTRVAAKVRLVNQASTIDVGEPVRERLERKSVELIEGFVGKEIKGTPPCKRLVMHHLESSKVRTLEADMIFVVAGVKPFVTVLRNAGLKTHRQGCVIVDDIGRTNFEGVFAAGGCASTFKDIVPACVGDGAAVATSVRLYLAYRFSVS